MYLFVVHFIRKKSFSVIIIDFAPNMNFDVFKRAFA